MEHTNQKKENKKKWLLVVTLLLICAFIIAMSVIAASGTLDSTPETTQITEPEVPLAGGDVLGQNDTAGEPEEAENLPSGDADVSGADDREAVAAEAVQRISPSTELQNVQGATFVGETFVDETPVDNYQWNPDFVEPDPVQPNPVEPNPVEPNPVEPNPVEPDPVEPNPVEPDPVEPDPVEPDPINVTVNAIEWLTAQLRDPQSDVYQYFDTRSAKTTLDSTGPNFAPTVNDQLRQEVEGIDGDSEFSWRIWKETNDQFNIFWTNEDISKMDKGDVIGDITKCTVDKNDTQEAEMVHGTAEVTTSQVTMGDGSKETINTIWGGSFKEDEPEAGQVQKLDNAEEGTDVTLTETAA